MSFSNQESSSNYMSSQVSILVVDDVPQNVRLLSILLNQHGYQVKGVNNAQMALEALETEIPQLILLDVMMPDMNGFELCEKIKSIPEIKEVPVIFLSALEEMKDKAKAFEVGGIDYINKPFEFEEVLMRVKNQLKLQQANQQIKKLNEELEARVKQRTQELEKEIIQHKETQKQLCKIAFYDNLTGLANRAMFLDMLQSAIEESESNLDYSFSVIFLDCDRFKLVNDSSGHPVGDKILKETACRLKACLHSEDTIARLGGDEFIVLLENIEEEDVNHTETVAQKLLHALQAPFFVNDREIFLGASLGLVINTKHYHSSEEILRDADMAMYKAKESGKCCYRVFKPEMHLLAQKKLQLETDLRLALEREEFELYYQPIFSFRNNCIKGFEALVRWNHPQKGLLSPVHFMPIAEETGLIVPLGIWILRQACHQLKVWQEQNFTGQNLTMNVNLSVKQFSQPNLLEQIDEIITQTQVDSKCLNLEITETAIMEHNGYIKDLLQKIREREIGLSIDDFGTGYSSLSYLHRFPIDQLKIDRSFIRKIQNTDDNINIVETIVNLARNLNMKIVAEGIENEAQFHQLNKLGCDFGQGYFFSKPLSTELISNLLNTFGEKIIF